MNEASTETLEMIIKMITEAGMDYHNFKVATIAKRADFDRAHGIETNLWEEIAEFPAGDVWGNVNNEAESARAWELAGVPSPYLDEEAA